MYIRAIDGNRREPQLTVEHTGAADTAAAAACNAPRERARALPWPVGPAGRRKARPTPTRQKRQSRRRPRALRAVAPATVGAAMVLCCRFLCAWLVAFVCRFQPPPGDPPRPWASPLACWVGYCVVCGCFKLIGYRGKDGKEEAATAAEVVVVHVGWSSVKEGKKEHRRTLARPPDCLRRGILCMCRGGRRKGACQSIPPTSQTNQTKAKEMCRVRLIREGIRFGISITDIQWIDRLFKVVASLETPRHHAGAAAASPMTTHHSIPPS
jgi:hypothetical protein